MINTLGRKFFDIINAHINVFYLAFFFYSELCAQRKKKVGAGTAFFTANNKLYK